MIRFDNHVEIERPIDDVFAYVSDLENIPEWNPAIAETRKLTPGRVAEGTVYQQLRTLPTVSEEQLEITDLRPGDEMTVLGQLGPFNAKLRYRFEDRAGSTGLTNDVELTPTGTVGMVASLIGRRIKTSVAQNLQTLKTILEA